MRGLAQSPETQPSLLVRIRDERDTAAWSRFVELYAPLIYGYVRKQGLQDADAADVAQEVLRVVASASKRLEYDPNRGTFRGWLFRVVQSRIQDFYRRQDKRARGTGDTNAHRLLQEQADPDPGLSAVWDAAYERQIFQYAAQQVRGDFKESTWEAFWATAVEGEPAKPVSERLGISVAAVYLAKGRVMARIKEQVRVLLGEEE